MKENKYLKWLLIIQSFLPLFFLILIRCFCLHSFKLVSQFFCKAIPKRFWSYLNSFKPPRFVFSNLVMSKRYHAYYRHNDLHSI